MPGIAAMALAPRRSHSRCSLSCGCLISPWGTGLARLGLVFAGLAMAASNRLGGSGRVLLAVYTMILAAQLVAIFFTQSRGPWLGLAGGLAACVVALCARARRPVASCLRRSGCLRLPRCSSALLICQFSPQSF